MKPWTPAGPFAGRRAGVVHLIVEPRRGDCMAGRYRDWIEQARADLALARTARDAGSHEWACFGFPAGKPADYFTREGSDAAIADADGLLGWVEQQVR